MSVLIKEMEMPKTCKECIFSRYILGEWFCRTTTTLDDDGMELWESVGKNGNFQRADFCPLVLVPPHGRLIDADEFCRSWDKKDHSAEYEHCSTLFAINESPTIIEAEE